MPWNAWKMNQCLDFQIFWRRPPDPRRREPSARMSGALPSPVRLSDGLDTRPCQILDPPLPSNRCFKHIFTHDNYYYWWIYTRCAKKVRKSLGTTNASTEQQTVKLIVRWRHKTTRQMIVTQLLLPASHQPLHDTRHAHIISTTVRCSQYWHQSINSKLYSWLTTPNVTIKLSATPSNSAYAGCQPQQRNVQQATKYYEYLNYEFNYEYLNIPKWHFAAAER